MTNHLTKKRKYSRPSTRIPKYHGSEWFKAYYPMEAESWELGKRKSIVQDRSEHKKLETELVHRMSNGNWIWPEREILFFSDMHADAEAFLASLVASGGVRKTGPADDDFEITKVGRQAEFIIGGDCLDKGPSNLRLLRVVKALRKKKVRLHLLGGNHDVRFLQGIRCLDLKKETRTEHFFIRMGPKMVPFLKEIHDNYLQGRGALKGVPSARKCRSIFMPSKRWFDEFPKHAVWTMPDREVEREVGRIQAKLERFEKACDRVGLGPRDIYAAAQVWKRMFLKKRGEFSWFYKEMQMTLQRGSFLFLHAGLDDHLISHMDLLGVDGVNKLFKKQLLGDPFEFYYGFLTNAIRTKYRVCNRPLTRRGVEKLHEQKILALVHGHLNHHHGQRIMLRKGLINFECDTTMDRNTRSKEGLDGVGMGVTIFRPNKQVLGVSSDFPAIKLFVPPTGQE
ncbi:metallophosphoesterase family protein [Magnetococcus sp. PR-3]|uniref:metallophosphoesterase family protein n=1 Tax=Magnetococcus sp. PR-3 TaxID=3120355 RepID=UPI002FCE381F